MREKTFGLIIPTRPLFVAFLVIFIVAELYCGVIYTYSSGVTREGEKIILTDTVNGKNYDADGNLKNIVLGDTLVYASNTKVLTEPVLDGKATVIGEVYSFSPAMNRGGFDTEAYYAARGIKRYIVASKLYGVSQPSVPIREKLLQLRMSVADKIMEGCPVEGATVVTLMLGDKRFMDEDRSKLYQRAGVSHFLVISGLHISALGAFIYRIVYRLLKRRIPACVFAMVILFVYGMLIGFSVSVTRALIMYAVRLLADAIGESYDMVNAVSLAGLITVIQNPLLVRDTSFLYSYGTVISIAVYMTFFQKRRIMWRKTDRIKEFFRPPLVLMTSMMPLNLWLSYEYCVAGVVANAIVVVVAAPVLAVSASALLFSTAGFFLPAHVCDFVLAVFFKGLDALCTLCVSIPGVCISGKPTVWQFVLYYVLLISGAVGFRDAGSLFYVIYRLAIMSLVTARFFFSPTVSMLYAGQGECIIIKTGNRTAIMSDAGSTSEDELYEYTVLPFLKYEGINRLEAVFVSHGDKDHVSALADMLDDYDSSQISIGALVVSDVSDEKKGELLCGCIEKAIEEEIAVAEVGQGDCLKVGKWNFDIIWPKVDTAGISDSNEMSLVMYATCDDSGFSMLFTGDIDEKSEEKIMRYVLYKGATLSGCVLKVAHHGSKTATCKEFLDGFSYDCALISAGIGNSYGHPHRATLSRIDEAGIKYFATNDFGEIDIVLYGNKGYKIDFWRNNVIFR